LTPAEQQAVEHILFKMVGEEKLRAKGYAMYLKLLLMELMIFIDRFEESPQRSESFDSLDPYHKKICEIVQYLNNHYAEKITLESTAAQYYMSYHYLSRSFKAVTGFSFIEYLNRIRIEIALKKLRTTKMSISDISESVGFGTVTHFQRNFKLMVGVSPLKYRKLKGSLPLKGGLQA